MENSEKQSFFQKLWTKIRKSGKEETNVYFISGMCYNCKVFDKLILPKGFKKVYLEWHIPQLEDSLSEYAHKMAEQIDIKHPFALVGFSFGGVIVQEMSKFLFPAKQIIISSFKNEKEIPSVFYIARKTQILRRTPLALYSTDLITKAFNKVVYDLPPDELAKYMTVIDPVYIKWATIQITDWIPDNNPDMQLYHIHGTHDQIFSYYNSDCTHIIEGGDHLMVIKKAGEVSTMLRSILLGKIQDKNKVS